MAKSNDTSASRSTTKNSCQERQIKVTRAYYDYKPKDASPYQSGQYRPWIQLKGKWLEQAGFSVDTPVKVRVMEGCLVLTIQEQIEPGFE